MVSRPFESFSRLTKCTPWLQGSLTAAALTISVLPLNRLSDRIGRKPILLLGLSVALMSILWVGLAKTFWSLAASQCFRGLFDGNISVSKNVIGEMTDYTNRSRAFSLFLILSTCGRTLGLLIGGDLQKRSSSLFGIEFFKQHPYFLPCLVVAIILAIAFIVILFFLEETAPRRVLGRQSLQEESSQTYSPPLRELAVYPVIIAVANYTGLVFLNQCENALLPLVFAMPVEIGGLGFNPAQIGYILGAYSLLTTFFLAFFFGPIIRFFGERRFFIFCVFSQLLMWVMLPIIHQYARHFGIGAHVWVGLAVMSLPHVCVEMGFGCIYTYLIGAAPNRRSMSSTIAVAYVISSIFGIMVPTMATSLFSYSIQHNILGGYAVYAVISFWTVLATLVAFCLPFDARPVWERERS
ncbi:major facilitator superfamily domain-containing protein [Crepidotus variabilis]|uniref:Major facilitator superfamily domain-containing protein n=1 Tax=Crepidotus variabilis TaxID=179855 RepID=A0A9P6JMI4_9AGAR|nr:major facilitator superfamily domain-containing protein [Crepidotus variabilis]